MSDKERRAANVKAQLQFKCGDQVYWETEVKGTKTQYHGHIVTIWGKEHVILRSQKYGHLQQVECADLFHLTNIKNG